MSDTNPQQNNQHPEMHHEDPQVTEHHIDTRLLQSVVKALKEENRDEVRLLVADLHVADLADFMAFLNL